MVALSLCLILAAPSETWSYKISPGEDGRGVYAGIDLTISGVRDVSLKVPGEVAGEQELERGITELRVNGQPFEVNDGGRKIGFKPGQPLRVTYKLREDAERQNASGYRPYLRKEFMHWLGDAGLVTNESKSAKVKVEIVWERFPKDWTFASSFGVGPRQKFEGSPHSFAHSVWVAGDFRLLKREVKGYPVYLALRGAWGFTDEQLLDLLGKVTQMHRDFWKDYSYPYYLVTMIPLQAAPGSISIGGTGLANSFATFCTTNCSLTDLTYLFAHELFHHWNPQKFGRFVEPEQQMYWFSEGFTDYYTYKLLNRNGLLTREAYVEKCNEVLRNLYLSPYAISPNSLIVEKFFRDPEVAKLPYQRGFILASRWDAEIAAKGDRSLDDLMLELRKRDMKVPLSAAVITKRAEALGAATAGNDWKAFIDRGELPTPSPNMFGSDYVLQDQGFGPFELGFDLNIFLKDKKFAGVKPGTAAYEAGLRDGQTMVKAGPFSTGNPRQTLEFVVKEGESTKTVKYQPQSLNTTPVPQFVRRG